MEALLRLGHAAASVHEDGVEEVGVAVVQLAADRGERAREEGAERLLLASGDVTEDADVLREDVLAGADDGDGLGVELRASAGTR